MYPISESNEVKSTDKSLCSIQLVFSNFYLGIALGALDFAKNYTVKTTRPWPYGGDVSLIS
jgi:hypothetical protein